MKLVKLLPLAGIAAITAPIVTSCACSLKYQLRYELFDVGDDQKIPMMTIEDPINLKKNKKYQININVADWKGEKGLDDGWVFAIAESKNIYDGVTKTSPMSEYKVWIDDRELEFVDDPSDMGDGQFSYKQFYNIWCLLSFDSKIEENSKIRIEFKVPEAQKEMYLILTIGV